MAVSLLKLSDGRLSLEFTPDDLDRVAAALGDLYGKPTVQEHPTLIVYAFPQAELVFQNAWDDPCLVSGCETGDQMLEQVAARLAG